MPGDTSEEGSEDTDPIVLAGDDEEVGDDGQIEDGTVVVREDQAGEGTGEDEEGAEDEEEDTGAEEEDTGAEKLSRTPASEDSMLYSTSILKEFSGKMAEKRLVRRQMTPAAFYRLRLADFWNFHQSLQIFGQQNWKIFVPNFRTLMSL